MGQSFVDQYSLLHFAVGVVSYFWNLSLALAIGLHSLFEWTENTQQGMSLINQLPYWPGGKTRADSLTNIAGDTVAFGVGWLAASILDQIGTNRGWYPSHLAQK